VLAAFRRPAARGRPCAIYGWAYLNRAALIPTYQQTLQSIELVERERLKGVLTIDMVVPDYSAKRPKPCMGGWGKGFMNITPTGKVLPCHAAETIPGLHFDNAQVRPLLDI
jgi:PqqA peptide cyclase